MMKSRIILYMLSCCILTSCFKDIGNYDLHPINEIELITNATDTMEILQFDTLRISVDLDQSIPVDESQLTFRWNAYPYPNGGTDYELGNQRDLAAPIGMKPGNYRLQYTITDTVTDISKIETYLLVVSGKLSEGWLVLEEKPDGTQDVSIVNPDQSIIRDLYYTANAEPLPPNSSKVQVLNANIVQLIFVYAEDDGVQVENASFTKINNQSDWFLNASTTGKVTNQLYTKYAFGAFIIVDNDVHVYAQIPHQLTKYGAPMKGNWSLSEYAIPKDFNAEAIFYDTKNQRFLIHQQNKLMGFSHPAGSAFDMNNVGKELLFIGPSLTTYYNCVMKNNHDDQVYIYRVNLSGAIAGAEVYQVEDAPGIERATFFASSGLYLHIYYAVDNKIYLLDIPAKKSRLVYSFPAGTAITSFKLKQSFGLFVSYPDNNRTLAVATQENNEGKLYTFPISNTGDFENGTYHNVIGGFGKILDIDYKNRPF